MVAICLISALVLCGARALATYLQSHARFSAIGSTNRLHHFSLGWMWNSGDDIPKAFAVSQFSSIIRLSETGFQTCQTSSSECLTQQRHLILSDAWPLLSFNEMYWKLWEITDGCILATFVPIALLFMAWQWPSAFGYFSILVPVLFWHLAIPPPTFGGETVYPRIWRALSSRWYLYGLRLHCSQRPESCSWTFGPRLGLLLCPFKSRKHLHQHL